ncbi:hypothetical protein [Azospirillum sp.]|uniref:hypothetical protein n=1 Tax=Azospirillum sp. TaxID=34012 RepID=UPI003D739BA4
MTVSMHIERCHAIVVEAPVHRVFPLLTPLGERRWVAEWEPEFLHPASGDTQEGMIFRTNHGGETTLWSCVRWEPERHRVRYARVTPESRFGFVDVACDAIGQDHTRATIAYAYTALSDEGAATLDALTDDAFRVMIEGWKPLLEACLRTPV